MREDIVSKLNDFFLQKAFKGDDITEQETLYTLAQIRKLSEHLTDKECEIYSTLLFYCDWALHTKLDRAPVRKVLEDLGENWKLGWGPNGKDEFFGFITFREELETFLRNFGINTTIATEQDEWFDFRRHLIQILIDAPLERTDTRIVRFSLLKKASTIGTETDDYHYWYQVVFDTGETEEWNVILADYGPKRRAQVREENARFMQRFIDKVRYRKEAAERQKSTDPDTSTSPTGSSQKPLAEPHRAGTEPE